MDEKFLRKLKETIPRKNILKQKYEDEITEFNKLENLNLAKILLYEIKKALEKKSYQVKFRLGNE